MFKNLNVSSGPLSSKPSESALVPQQVLDLIQTSPINNDTALVQTGNRTLNFDPNKTGVPDLPTYGVEQVPAISGQTSPDIPYTTNVVPLSDEQSLQDYREQGERLAEPTNYPIFNTQESTAESLGNAIRDIGTAYKNFNVETLKRTTDPGEEAADLSHLANKLAKPMFRPDEAPAKQRNLWANDEFRNTFFSDMGVGNPDGTINQQVVDALPGIMLLTTAGALSDVRSRKYKDFVEKETREYDFESLDQNTNENLSPEERDARYKAAQEAIGSSPQDQPVMTSFVNSFKDRLGKLSVRPTSAGSIYRPNSVSQNSAAGAAYTAYTEGLFNIGKDKHGTYYPILTEKGERLVDRTQHAAAVYDVDLRAQGVNEPLIKSQSNAPVANRFAGKYDMMVNNSKRLNPDIDLTEAFAITNSAVGYVVNPVNLRLLGQMANNIAPITMQGNKPIPTLETGEFTMQGRLIQPSTGLTPTGNTFNGYSGETFKIPFAYSSSVYNKSIVDLSPAKVEEKVKELLADNVPIPDIIKTITDINKSKLDQVNKHINDYLEGNLKRGVRFGTLKISGSTNRFFMTATDINQGNHGGTIRPVMSFGKKYSTIVSSNVTDFINDSHRMADSVYNTGKSGIDLGNEINKNLWDLGDSKLAKLDAAYQMAKAAHEFGLMSIQGNRPTPQDFIKAFRTDSLINLAALGSKFLQWSNGSLPSNDTTAISPKIKTLSELFTKKEWEYLVNNAIMAHDIVSTAQKGGGSVVLDATLESDASQSNASIMSLAIGNIKIANILGFYFGADKLYENVREEYKDLRNLVSSAVDEDIDATMTSDKEKDRKEALKKYLDSAREVHGSSFDKMYARGIVVAGLYGKAAEALFTEAETMISSIGLSNELDALENEYNGNRQELLEDIASCYATSMKRHLADLQGFQKLVAGMASLKAAANGKTEIKVFGNTTIDLGISYATQASDESNTVREILGLPEEVSTMSGIARDLGASESAGKSLREIRQQRERLAKTNKNITDLDDQLLAATHAGGKVRKAMPVTITQSGDSFFQATSYLYANRRNKSDQPLNMYGIHDAQKTAPGSTLLMHNAYNNISPYLLAENSTNLLQNIYDSIVKEDYPAALADVRKDGYANIGALGKYKAVGGYFNRLYNSKYYIPRNIERGRKTDKSAYDIFSDNYRDEVLNIAISLGWAPPTNRNIDKHENNKVSVDTFQKLFALIKYSEGFAKKEEAHPFPSLEKMVSSYNANQKAIKEWGTSPHTRKTRMLEKFKNDNQSMIRLMKSNKNYIVNSK
jgi:hypothetical protein